eukprot:CAMPEP_0117024186 /NCGR_PEP_ID=MMETSP0472-20121206/17985_1 /TAXON_ID=693140 ORGANISM="Tiarina fusus, Strain LIS" /NCGR_SAMPLE_ID=MMETSP0472 /ASSEMBLY_ACC=CAM_ASM_000603 /LENGTH=674 /DNA_ID=CAMNT_0004730541 /DNA_START=127 /DNA_END=2151 /DNA_ORIENTATION=-
MARTRNTPEIEYGNDASHERPAGKKNLTFLIVIVSLLFVAVFGGALVGGVVSGDPSNAFFFTIIGASAFAIGVACLVSIRFYLTSADDGYEIEDYEKDVRGTFTRSEDEDDDGEDGEDEEDYYDDAAYRSRFAKTPVDARIKEVRAKSVAGDVSALSPSTYEADSYASRREYSQDTRDHQHRSDRKHRNDRGAKRGPFDFASVASSRRTPVRRQDPPEEAAPAVYYDDDDEPRQQRSMDPEAPRLTASGEYEESDIGLNTPTSESNTPTNGSVASMSATSRYDTPYDDDESTIKSERKAESVVETDIESEIEVQVVKKEKKKRGRSPLLSRMRSRSRSKSPSAKSATSSQIQSSRSGSQVGSDNEKETKKSTREAPPPPPPRRADKPTKSSKSSRSSKSAKSIVPPTPTASETGSTASSMFLKPFSGMFGKKRPASEAGYSDTSNYVRGQGSEISGYNTNRPKSSETQSEIITGRPPMSNKRISFEPKKRGLETIGGKSEDKYAPSNLAKTGIFSMPSPKPVPSTPGSESYKSMAESSVFSGGVASSTFNPQSRERALNRVARNTASLGANFNDMPIYYEDESEVGEPAQSGSYDVFAPPGPIGIVVDTIAKGCIVHSLKKSSPMQGLITPGDLIVALDDVDVRKMDAAALTKLMAKKSQQKERKFTLISSEDY